MLASIIVQVVLRLFSLWWLVQGLVAFGSALTTYRMDLEFRENFLWLYLPAIFEIFLAATAWMAAPRLGRLILGKQDTVVAISGLSLEDIYSFAFVFLGLYFALDSLAGILNWMHYFFITNASSGGLLAQTSAPSHYELSRSVITFLAGMACIAYGRRWAGKMIKNGK